tara:strand:- start:316 stop:549 length:234 start_codon:yes stop_codon:yes gene_type:complete
MSKSIGAKIYARIVEEDGGKTLRLGTEKDIPNWEEENRMWEEEEDFSTDGDSIDEVGTTDDVEQLLTNINKLIEEHY